jgi:YidC/Oxa1 family membrane protein insertase
MPFFWAFFVYFTTSFDVRHTPWLGWVTDLSAPDPYYILPVLMCGAQIGSTMITPMPASDDPAMRFQRTLMTWVLPVVFTYFFLVAAPSGLVLYWMTLNLVGIGSQFLINRIMPQEQEAAAQASVAKDKAKARA